MEKVSIVIPVYNRRSNQRGAEYLREAIDSALSQTYENIEVIVVNDGSDDEGASERTALSYGEKIRYFHKENGGVSSALNFGISKANGDWISWLSHDDLYTCDKISTQMEDVEKVKALGKEYRNYLYYCRGGFMDSNGEPLERNVKTLSDGLYESADAIHSMLKRYGIGGCGLLMPKKMFDETGGFNEEMRYSQDWFMWISAFICGYGIYVNNKVMSITRMHNMQMSTLGKEYLQTDRERMAGVLYNELEGKTDSANNNLLKEYMYLCAIDEVNDWGRKIYKKLRKRGEAGVADLLKYFIFMALGKTKSHLKHTYYLLRYGINR